MIATLIINGKEFEIDIKEEDVKKLKEKPKHTGYERVADNERYYYNDRFGCVVSAPETCWVSNDVQYQIANYYSDETIAEDNARADKLMRQLRRFAAEHNAMIVDKAKIEINGAWVIRYIEVISEGAVKGAVEVKRVISRYFGDIYFDSYDTAMGAVAEYHDELMWYFTEYKESL